MLPTRIAVLAFDGISPFHLSVPCAVFGEAAERDRPPFELRVCAARAGRLATSAGFGVDVAYGLRTLAWADMVIVPSWAGPTVDAPADLLRALQRAHARGARIVGLCLGAFVVAQAGLLDGRRAATHWRAAAEFARRFARVTLDADVLYVDEGDVVTSAGTAAGIDCCLHLLRQHSGADAASRAARYLVVPPHRQGGQAQYIERPVVDDASGHGDRLFEVLAWAQAHLEHPHSLDALAARARMSRRTFTRHVRARTGATVNAWLTAQRVAAAQRLLETSALPVEQVAARVGFGSTVSLRQHFAVALGTSPQAYRRAFKGAGV
ncbi:MAG: helix-turn-helix domain-containing protein [Rhodocyclaceae bacterium]